jgi:urocanate hydratase
MMAENPILFKEKVQETLRRHTTAINKHTAKGTYFFDYGNAFLLEARAGADIMADNHMISNTELRTGYHPMCFDLVWSFRWFVLQENQDLQKTDTIARQVLEEMAKQHH